VHFTADYYGAHSSSGLMHCVCAGEQIDDTGQVVRDAEERSIPGPVRRSTSPASTRTSASSQTRTTAPSQGFTNNYWFSDYNGVFATNWSRPARRPAPAGGHDCL
jgi:hypothetical protein